MTKIAIVVFSDTNTMEAMGKVSNAFILASESIEAGDELKIIFEGAGTKWIGELENPEHMLNGLYKSVKNSITGACSYCANAFGVQPEIEKAEIPLISEYNNHPSLRKLITDGYSVLTF